MNAREARQVAVRTLDRFDELLDEENVTIPCGDREGRDEEARL